MTLQRRNRQGSSHWMFLPVVTSLLVQFEFSNGADTWEPLSVFEMVKNKWGVDQKVFDADAGLSRQVLDRMEKYMTGNLITYEEMLTCTNKHPMCANWAMRGECNANQEWMSIECAPACQTCHKVSKRPLTTNENGNETVEIEWGQGQRVDGNNTNSTREQVLKVLHDMNDYMTKEVFVDQQYAAIKDACKCDHEMCSLWASQGECENNPKWMKMKCAPACKTCEFLDYNVRCPKVENAVTAWRKGDLNRFFENLMTDPSFQQYSPSIVSSPDTSNGPWIVQLDNFASKEECENLIRHGTNVGYDESSTVGFKNSDGTYTSIVNPHRTSTTAWCNGDCYEDDMTKRLTLRIENITDVPSTNFEYLQLLRYQEGQFYKSHSDFLDHHLDYTIGPRILTFYMYLNDVEEGGGTRFPNLDLTVEPKQGRAVIWPSVTNDDPFAMEPRTDHEALPVIRGFKYGANAWIHQHDYKGPEKEGCA